MNVVSNSSSLIYLSKIGKLELLKKLFVKVFIPGEVFEEVVVKGKLERHAEVISIENGIKDRWIIVKNIKLESALLRFAAEIDAGEAEVIALSSKLRGLTLMDDSSGRRVAESFGLNVKGTLYVVLLALRKGFLSRKEAKECIEKLIKAGFRLSAETYAEAVKEIERYKIR